MLRVNLSMGPLERRATHGRLAVFIHRVRRFLVIRKRDGN